MWGPRTCAVGRRLAGTSDRTCARNALSSLVACFGTHRGQGTRLSARAFMTLHSERFLPPSV